MPKNSIAINLNGYIWVLVFEPMCCPSCHRPLEGNEKRTFIQSPNGRRHEVFGRWNHNLLREYAELNAPHRLTEEARAKFYDY